MASPQVPKIDKICPNLLEVSSLSPEISRVIGHRLGAN